MTALDQQKGRSELAPSEAAHQSQFAQPIVHIKHPEIKSPSLKRLRTVQALLAMRGVELVRNQRASDGRAFYVASRAGDARHFTHWHDVEAFLSSLGVRP